MGLILMTDIGGVWRTVGGRRIFIKDGQSLSNAMINSGKFPSTKGKIQLENKLEDNTKLYEENLIPEFMRGKTIEANIMDLRKEEAVEYIVSQIKNPKVKKMVEEVKIEYGSTKNSYNPNKKIINLKDEADVYSHLHEIGHYIDDKLNISKDKKFKKIIKNKFFKYKAKDFEMVTNETGTYYVLKKYEGFVSKYQTRIYTPNSFILGKPNISKAKEYISEGMKFYFKDKKELQKKDPELYNYIKEIVG